MKRAGLVIAGACLLDAVVGDPHRLPHPVRFMGTAIQWADECMNGGGNGTRWAGALLTMSLIGVSALAGAVVQRSLIGAIVLGASTLAARDLLTEVTAVAVALERQSLATARERVARIVGRDTAALGPGEVARAAIETLAESACDGIVAPLFWFAVAGVPGALAFKAASTLDSMIGHREPRYVRFGAFAARLDDALNLLPARITAGLIALAGGKPRRTLEVLFADAGRHASPNAGWPEAALAAALDVRLGGSNTYAGVVHCAAVLNEAGRAPQAPDIRRALRLVVVVVFIAELVAIAVRR